MDTKGTEALRNALNLTIGAHYEYQHAATVAAELGEQGYAIVPVSGPLAWRDPTSGTPEITPHEREVNEVVEAGRTLLRHGADPGTVRWAVEDTIDSIGLAPDGEDSFVEAVLRS